ncbi:hypothetical protein DTPHA_1406463 [Enterococcus faecium]|nr:hypothetical protein DTPHA_1406463 [Enterococcus faecium]
MIITVALAKLMIPKTVPKPAPMRGPKTMDAIMTGICIVVALIGPIGIKPSGVTAKIIMIAKNIAVKVKLFTFFSFICYSFNFEFTICTISATLAKAPRP